MVNKAELVKWLRKAIEIGRSGVVANAFKLIHASIGNAGTDVEEWGRSEFGDVGDLAQKIIDVVNRDSSGSEESTVIYHVLPYFGESLKPLGRFPIRVENINFNDPETSSLMPQEGPSAKGMLGQNQRHLEGLWKLTAGSIHEAMRRLSEENSSLREQVKQMSDMHLQMVQMREDLLDRKQERQMKAGKEAASEERMRMLLEYLMPFVPLVINKIRGSRDLPELINPDVEQFKAFLGSIKPEEFTLLMNTFNVRLAPIVDLAIKYKKEHEDKKEKMATRIEEMMPTAPPLPSSPSLRGLSE